MADLSVTGLADQDVKVGDTATFEVTVTGGTEPYKYAWKHGNEPARGADETKRTYVLPNVTAQDAGDYKVDVTDKDGKTGSSETAHLTVKEKEDELILWNQEFAVGSLKIAAVVLAILWLFFWLAAWRLLPKNGQEAMFSGFIAMAAVIVGVLAIVAGIYLAVLEYRGRARTIDEIKEIREAQQGTKAGGADSVIISELVKVLPQSLKAFGDLKAAFATMLVGVILFVCATAIAWKAAPENGGATTPTTTGAAQPPPPPPPPATPPPPPG